MKTRHCIVIVVIYYFLCGVLLLSLETFVSTLIHFLIDFQVFEYFQTICQKLTSTFETQLKHFLKTLALLYFETFQERSVFTSAILRKLNSMCMPQTPNLRYFQTQFSILCVLNPSHQYKMIYMRFRFDPLGEQVPLIHLGSKGRHSGERARLPPMWPGFDSRRRRHMWIEFIVGSLLCSERFFSG